ncbi:MAG: PAS domain S-box protein [Candidatus Hydrogenedentes bacterium]|nr:PAS domain S-box protein [Candidatus Hydrogenedentota bacterium]
MALLIGSSILLQLIAMGFAAHLGRVTRRYGPWLAIAAALALMAVRRTITLERMLSAAPLQAPDLMVEILAFLISLLAVLGLARVAPIFRSLRQLAETQHASQQLVQSILDGLSAHIALLDNRGTIITVNPAWRRFAEASGLCIPRHSVGQNYVETCDRAAAAGIEEGAAMAEGIRSVLNGACAEFTLEYPCERDGEPLWFVARVTRASGAEPIRIVVTHEDVTALKRAAQALSDSQARNQEILDNSLDLAHRLNLVTETFDYFSPSVTRMTGLSVVEALSLTLDGFLALIHPEDAPVYAANIARRSCDPPDPGAGNVMEYRFRHASGEYRWFAEHSNPVRDRQGRLVALVGTIRDVTDRKRGEEAILGAARMEATATLAGGIAHEFNNLMVGVLGNAELLRSDFVEDSDSETSEMLTDISESARRAGQLACQMLAFARGGKFEHKVCDLADIVRQTLTLRESLVRGEVTVTTEIADTRCLILGDPGQLSQVVVSLFTNAVEAISESGEIGLGLTVVKLEGAGATDSPPLPPGSYAKLTVCDTGCGMTPEVRRRAFEPFFTTKFQGRGLGLAAVYGIVRSHNGSISVRSGLGQGSEFEVLLPVTAEAPE